MPFIQFQFRKGTATEWSGSNPTLASAELGVETDTNKFKIGNGSSPWNALPYVLSPFPYTGSAEITGSLVVTGSVVATAGFTGSFSGSLGGSFPYSELTGVPSGIVSSSTQINNLVGVSASFAISASWAPGGTSTTDIFNPFFLAGM